MGEQINAKKELENIRRNKRGLARTEELLKTQCTHTKHGQLTITSANKGGQPAGKMAYVCKQCEKDVILSLIDEKELRRACEVLDIACDTIKITLDLNREEDMDIFKKVSKFQYRVRNEICDFYAASAKRNRKGGGNKGGNNNGGGNNNNSPWSRPNSL